MPLPTYVSAVRPTFMIPFGVSPDFDNVAPAAMALHMRMGGIDTAYASGAASAYDSGDTSYIDTSNNGVIVATCPWIVNTRVRIVEISWAIRTTLALHGSTANSFFLRIYRGTESLVSLFRSSAAVVPGTGWAAETWYQSPIESPFLVLNPRDVITVVVRSETAGGAYALTGTARQCSVSGMMTLEYVD